MVMSLRKNKRPVENSNVATPKKHIKWSPTSEDICFFDVRGVLHAEVVPQGQSANQAVSSEVFKRFRNSMMQKIPDLWGTLDGFASMTMHLLTRPFRSVIFYPKTPWLTYPTPLLTWLFLFPWMKRDMKGHWFGKVEDVNKSTKMKLANIQTDEF